MESPSLSFIIPFLYLSLFSLFFLFPPTVLSQENVIATPPPPPPPSPSPPPPPSPSPPPPPPQSPPPPSPPPPSPPPPSPPPPHLPPPLSPPPLSPDRRSPPPPRKLSPPPPLPPPPPGKSGLNAGQITGIAFGGIIVTLQMFVGTFLVIKKRQLFHDSME